MTELAQTYPPVRWRNSLVVRVVLLCAVLILCLLGSVVVLTQHFMNDTIQAMETQTADIIRSIELRASAVDAPSMDAIEMAVGEELGVPLDVELSDTMSEAAAIWRESNNGGYERGVVTTFELDGQVYELETFASVAPMTEIVRAFNNRYLILLAGIFVLTLGVMLYWVARTLRPLRDLAETCEAISEGHLNDVKVYRNAGEVQALAETFNHMVTALREKDVVESNLRQAQRLSAIGNLAAGVAHDVRNPLNAIKLLSSHAMDTLDGSSDAGKAKSQLGTIRQEVDRLEEIVSGFLSLAKERELQPEPSRIDAVLNDTIHLVEKDAQDRDIRLITELRAGDTTIMLDPKQWTRAILNVLINAMEACPAGGRVRLFSRVTDTDCEIEIRDDGPGIGPEASDRVFEPYFTTKPTGTGLGLSITRGIVEEHGGSVQLTSTDEGCQVLIRMPLEPKPV
jgi:signal transduction histidine kinase